MLVNLRLGVGLALVAAILSGCTATPRAGPDDYAIEANAYVKVSTKGRKVGIEYALLDIDSSILAYFGKEEPTSLGGFGGGKGGPPALPLGIGDIVTVSIFEAQSGGLFIPADAGSRPGNFITLPEQTIDRSGTISVPYAGRISAAGRSVDDVQAEIEDLLANRAIEPQVVITTIKSRSSQVSVLGDVRAPAKFELSPAGDRVLDMISQAGGLSAPGIETYVTLQRRGRTATVLYDHLADTPAENIYVAPGDTIFVNRERRTYLAFGATGLSGRFDFEESGLTLGEALGKAGGLLDGRADPAQVMLYRVVSRQTLVKLGVDVHKFASDEVPVIFRANLRDPAAFFAVQKFAMSDKDIVYVSNSDSVELLKFLNLVNSVSATAAGVSDDVVDTRNALRAL
ncbi:polysaccharide biosynthesis/export family protein [Shinella sp. S4-D37]|uniref:polysaccharide biosynthesis/export family protein n=1 Tax=Shinella sp. S4-D37 TaxID=3161999 RepID=UPI00346769B1